MRRLLIDCVVFLMLVDVVFGQKQVDDVDGKVLLVNREAARFQKMVLANAQQTENQADYDVRYYDIRLDIFPATEQIVGSVEVDADVVGDALDRLEVNLLDNMFVDSVKVEDRQVSFTHVDDIVTIPLDRIYNTGESVRVRISYYGSPQRTGFGSFGFDRYNGQPLIWSLSEPFGARNWWPCKDVPADKADSVDIRVSVPSNLVVASNGLLQSVISQGDKKTYWWHEKYPIATYLVSVAIHPYTVISDSVEVVSGRQMPIDHYVLPDQTNAARMAYAKTKDMIAVFADLFGPYPFHEEKYGHAQYDRGACMEHQTISTMKYSADEYVIAHELAHQWWGDLVTCDDFSHIWLNEGFATYSEALWAEFCYGEGEYWNRVNANKYFGGGTIFVTEMNLFSIFSGNLSYRKASWVLHMLRHVVGDTTFFEILRRYASDLRFSYGTATTEGFQQVCEEVSGQDLGDFFHQWIYEEYYPQYALSYATRDSNDYVVTEVNIEQVQTNTVIFHMPIDLCFRFAVGDTTIVVDNDKAEQTHRFVFDRQPFDVELDPEGWILKTVEFESGLWQRVIFDHCTWPLCSVRFVDEETGWIVGGSNTILKTVDGGDHWSHQDNGIRYPAPLESVYPIDEMTALAVGTGGTVLKTIDGGNEWSPRFTGTSFDLKSLFFVNPDTGWTVGYGNTILKTIDGGDHWIPQFNSASIDYLHAVYFVDDSTGWVVGSDVILKTTDGGTRWDHRIDYRFNCLKSVFFIDENMGWAVGLGGTILKTTDGGINWVFQTSGTSNGLEEIHFVDEKTGWVVGRDSIILQTTDGGTHWTSRMLEGISPDLRSVYFVDADNGWIVGDDGTALRTTAGGETGVDNTDFSEPTFPNQFVLLQNYPNPFNPSTTIRFHLPASDRITLKIYNLIGEEIETLVSGIWQVGEHRVIWHAKGLPSGLYFLRLEGCKFVETKKMVLQR